MAAAGPQAKNEKIDSQGKPRENARLTMAM